MFCVSPLLSPPPPPHTHTLCSSQPKQRYRRLTEADIRYNFAGKTCRGPFLETPNNIPGLVSIFFELICQLVVIIGANLAIYFRKLSGVSRHLYKGLLRQLIFYVGWGGELILESFAPQEWFGLYMEGILHLKMLRQEESGYTVEVELPCEYYLYAPRKYKRSVRNAIRQRQLSYKIKSSRFIQCHWLCSTKFLRGFNFADGHFLCFA